MDRRVELRILPPRIIIEAYLSGSFGGGGLDGNGPMVMVDLKRGKMVALPGFRNRLEAWSKAGGVTPCPLSEMPTLRALNAFVNRDPDVFYDTRTCRIVETSTAGSKGLF